MFCNKCGAKLDDGAVFCSNCGNRMATAPASTPRPTPTPAPGYTPAPAYTPAPVHKPAPKFTVSKSVITAVFALSALLFFFHALHLLWGGMIHTETRVYYVTVSIDTALPGVLAMSGGLWALVLAAIFYFTGFCASACPVVFSFIKGIPPALKKIFCDQSFIQAGCLFMAFIFYIVSFAIGASKTGAGVSFFCIFELLLQLTHIGVLVLLNFVGKKD